AHAQTNEAPRAFCWTGPCIGLHGGYASHGNAERVKINGGLLAGLQAGYLLGAGVEYALTDTIWIKA
ncbi:hypothetical protein, partial [Escherichia coli]